MENGRLLRHFGLLSEPFRISPRRRDFFPPGSAPRGLDVLTGAGGDDPARLVLVSGEAGTGRTSTLRQIADTLRPAGWRVFIVETAEVPHPEHLSDDDILLAACRNFGLFRAMTERKPNAAAESLRAHAGKNEKAKTPIAIAVDDADRLADAALAGLLRLAVLVPAEVNSHAGGIALSGKPGPDLAVLFSGPSDLRQRLERVAQDVGLPGLWDRDAAQFELRPLSRDEVGAYVEYCLEVAGCPDANLFDAAAIDRLATVSRGVLGELNAMAAQAMIFAWQSSRRTINADLIEAPGARLSITPPTPSISSRSLVVVDPQGRSDAESKRRRRRAVWLASSAGVIVAAMLAFAVSLPEGRAVFRLGGEYLQAAFSSPPAPGVPANGVDAIAPAPAPASVDAVAPAPGMPSLAGVQRPGSEQPSDLPGEASAEFLVARGEVLLRGADAVSARRFFGRAAESGSAAAATAMAASYDPVYLERAAIRGVDADPEQAAAWYRIAIARGDPMAHERLDALVAAMAAAPLPPQ